MARVLMDIKLAIAEESIKRPGWRNRNVFKELFVKRPRTWKLHDLSARLAHVEAEFQVCV
jgi:hypothetical protein